MKYLGAPFGLCLFGSLAFFGGGVRAQDLNAALVSAYMLNPQLNAARANLRATDETVATAKSSTRLRLSADGTSGRTLIDSRTPSPIEGVPGSASFSRLNQSTLQVSASQTIFNGGKNGASIDQAEANVLGTRETLRNTEQNTLLDAVNAYVAVVRNKAVYDLRSNNVNVLNEQVRQTKDRFKVGEVTRTDVAQSEARLAQSKSDLALARSDLRASEAKYKQVIGRDPKKIKPASPVSVARLPKNKDDALALALERHPAIIAARYGVEAQLLQIKIVRAEFYPTVSLNSSFQRRFDVVTNNDRRSTTQVYGQITFPIYDGGLASAKTRAAKETAEERRLQVDSTREQVIQAVAAAWAQMEATGFYVQSAASQVEAAKIALQGVKEEARVGQRTTLDVLNAEQELVNARVSQVTAQRDRVVASYSLFAAIGSLSAQKLQLKLPLYDPKVHYEQVEGKLYGTSIPDLESQFIESSGEETR